MKIKDIELKSNLFLAPMAGVTDAGFRSIAREYGAGLSYTEMISVRGLFYRSNTTQKMLFTSNNESPVAVQLFGHEKDMFEKAINNKMLEKFDIIDINMGCPMPKIFNNGDGSALMKNLNLAQDIIETCVSLSDKPITVKFRTGVDDSNINAVEFAKMASRAGASAITVHGRTKEQMYSGSVNYDIIKRVKESVDIPVIGNGDIFDIKSLNIMKETGADGYMVARGALGRPWLFAELMGNSVAVNKYKEIEKHISILKQIYDERVVLLNMRKHFLWYLRDISSTSHIKNLIVRCESLSDAMELLKDVLI